MDYPATTIDELVAIGRQQRADALAAEEERLQQKQAQADQERQEIAEHLRISILGQIPDFLHPYIDWKILSCHYLQYFSTHIAIRIPECVEIAVGFDRRDDSWQWDGHYRILIPDHIEYDYQENGHIIHCERRVETDLPLALAAAADAYPKLQQLEAEWCALKEAQNQQKAEFVAQQSESDKARDQQRDTILRVLEADPVLRALFHAAIAYQNARETWDAQLSSQYQQMQSLEFRYEEDLNRTRRDTYDAEQRALGEAPAGPEPAPPPRPHTKPGLSPDDEARVRAQLDRRRGGA